MRAKRDDIVDELTYLQELITLPTWQAIDTSLPEQFSTGVSLLSLRKELEAGEIVSPLLFPGERPYCIKKSEFSKFFDAYTPPPWNDIINSYSSVDRLYAQNFHAHFPIWIVGESPAYKELEEQFEREMQAQKEEEAAVDAAPLRTIEVSEREYREILARRVEIAESLDPLGDLDDKPF